VTYGIIVDERIGRVVGGRTWAKHGPERARGLPRSGGFLRRYKGKASREKNFGRDISLVGRVSPVEGGGVKTDPAKVVISS